MDKQTNHCKEKHLPTESSGKTQLTNTTQWNKTRPKNEIDNHITRANFKYYASKIRKITNLFKHTNVKIAFKNTNTLQKLLKQKINNTKEYLKSWTYKLTCNTYHKAYIGQTSRSLKQRFQEHNGYMRHNDPQCA